MSDDKTPKTTRVQLNPAKVLRLGGTANSETSNPRMIGQKWSPVCKTRA